MQDVQIFKKGDPQRTLYSTGRIYDVTHIEHKDHCVFFFSRDRMVGCIYDMDVSHDFVEPIPVYVPAMADFFPEVSA